MDVEELNKMNSTELKALLWDMDNQIRVLQSNYKAVYTRMLRIKEEEDEKIKQDSQTQ